MLIISCSVNNGFVYHARLLKAVMAGYMFCFCFLFIFLFLTIQVRPIIPKSLLDQYLPNFQGW